MTNEYRFYVSKTENGIKLGNCGHVNAKSKAKAVEQIRAMHYNRPNLEILEVKTKRGGYVDALGSVDIVRLAAC